MTNEDMELTRAAIRRVENGEEPGVGLLDFSSHDAWTDYLQALGYAYRAAADTASERHARGYCRCKHGRRCG